MESFRVVNASRVKKKIPSLLVGGDTTKRKNNKEFMRNRYRLQQFQRRNPERFNNLTNQLTVVLEEIDREISIECITYAFANGQKSESDRHFYLIAEILVYELVFEFLPSSSWVFSIFSLIAHSMNC